MTILGSRSSVPAFNESSLELRLLQGLAALRKSTTPESSERCEREIHELMTRIGGREHAEIVPTLTAVLSLGNVGLATAALAALGNLEGGAIRAVPAILQAGLSGNADLLINASWALGSIADRSAVVALVELCKGSENYKVLVDYTLSEFIKYGEECVPFIARVQDRLSEISPKGVFSHIEKLNELRIQLRHERAKTYGKVDFPGQVALDPLIESGSLPIDEIADIEPTKLAAEGNPVADERFRFRAQGISSEVGLEIHRLLANDSPRHLVLFVEDECGFGVEASEIIDCLASVIGARYGLDPLSTYWATLTTRESGLAVEGRDELRLHVLKSDTVTGRYDTYHDFLFENMRALVNFLNASYMSSEES
jgi:hypothetical protein